MHHFDQMSKPTATTGACIASVVVFDAAGGLCLGKGGGHGDGNDDDGFHVFFSFDVVFNLSKII